jgi:hypothetical protein
MTLMGIGAALSQLVAPGVGPALFGALAGKAFAELDRPAHRQPRVFVSFDYNHDVGLKHLFVGQARNSRTPFSLIDHSLKEAGPERDWQRKAREKIRRSDLVIVLVGSRTHQAAGVLTEVAIARDEGKPIVQMISTKDGTKTRVKGAGRVIAWNWDRLEAVLARTS